MKDYFVVPFVPQKVPEQSVSIWLATDLVSITDITLQNSSAENL